MTLILSCITQEVAIQVADRRLILEDGSVYNDTSNKMTLFDGRIAFGYTGLAFLQGQRTDLWLKDLLDRPECTSADKALQLLRTVTSDTLRGINLPKHIKRLAFVGIGWSVLAVHKRPVPLICSVSNFHGEDGRVLAHASEEFRAKYTLLRHNQPFVFEATGQPLPVAVSNKCRWMLRHHVKKGIRTSKLLDILVRRARECAENTNRVGKDFLSAVIPQQAVSRQLPFILTKDGPPSEDIPSFRTWPGSVDYNAVFHPNYAGQRAVLSNFEQGTLGSGAISFNDSSFTIRYPCFYFTNEARTAMLTSHSAGMKCLSVFTERAVVETMQIVGGVRTARFQIESAEDFAALLKSIEVEFQGVFFNPGIEGKGCSVALGAMIRALTRGSNA